MIGGDTTFGFADEPLSDRMRVGPEKSERVSLEVVSMDVLRIATAGLFLVPVADCGDELDMLWSVERVDIGLENAGLASGAGDWTDVDLETWGVSCRASPRSFPEGYGFELSTGEGVFCRV